MKLEIEIENGFVVLPLTEYERLKEIERDSNELWEQHIRDILKGV